jgi:predicted nicotinamide N-methyase
MFLVDYLSCTSVDQPLGRVLDLGCGTGICGLSAYYLGASDIVLSDMVLSATLEENIDDVLQTAPAMPETVASAQTSSVEHTSAAPSSVFAMGTDATAPNAAEPTSSSSSTSLRFVEYNWDSPNVPVELSDHFDTVLCSDVLYDEKFHAGLLRCLDKLTFSRCLLSYKRRHDAPEKKFFLDLLATNKYSICAVDSAAVVLRNISKPSMLSGLHIFIITRM